MPMNRPFAPIKSTLQFCATALVALGFSAPGFALTSSDPDYVIFKGLVQRYQCIQAFNSGLFTGKDVSNGEFAKLISACASRIQSGARGNGANSDLAQLARLQNTYTGRSTPVSATVAPTQPGNTPTNFDDLPNDGDFSTPRQRVGVARATPQLGDALILDAPNDKPDHKFRLWGGIGTPIGNQKITFEDVTPNQYPDLNRDLVLDAGLDVFTDLQPVEGWDFFIGGRVLTLKGDYNQHKNVNNGATGASNGNIRQTYLALNLTLEKYAPIGDINGAFGFGVGAGPLFTNLDGTFNADGVNAALHLETFYRFKVTENISIAPVITAIIPTGSPSGNAGATPSKTKQDAIFVGVLRGIFEF